jgi:hypothetical protein
MRLSATLIVNYANINQFSYEPNQWKVRAADTITLYFQIIDLDQPLSCPDTDLRYMLGVGSANQPYSVFVKFASNDPSKELIIQAIQASPADSSIWQVTILPSQICATGNVSFTVIEGNNRRHFKLLNALSIEYTGSDCGGC